MTLGLLHDVGAPVGTEPVTAATNRLEGEGGGSEFLPQRAYHGVNNVAAACVVGAPHLAE
jgi:hypothetical protein